MTLPRDVNLEELQVWQRELNGKLASLWTEYMTLFDNLNQGRIQPAVFNEGLVKLCPRAQELLQYSTCVTSSNPEIGAQIMGGSGVAALAYADLMLQLGSIADARQQEAAGLAHQAMLRLLGGLGGGSRSAPDRTVFSQYFTSLSMGRLPAQYVNTQDWPRYVVSDSTFSRGDQLVLRGEVLKQVQMACKYFDLQAGKYADVGSTGGPPLSPGGFAGCSPLNLPPGEYELHCFVGETLVAVFFLTVR